MKKSHFLVIGDFYLICFVIYGNVWVVTGEPPPYCAKIPTKSPVCMVVFFLFLKSWNWVRPNPNFLKPEPQPYKTVIRWDEIPTLAENMFLQAPLIWSDVLNAQVRWREYFQI